MSADNRLVIMANQMGRFFTPQRGVDSVAAIANHIGRFWDPRMRAAIVAHLAAGGAGLDEPVREAVGRLKEAKEAAR
ncbi:MAG: formate dehydrogenase subunit delta [Alphaproteobacteria bacterium]|nr:formate dehydrogenase subunit delta [Alphaproteobacteria bacterium]